MGRTASVYSNKLESHNPSSYERQLHPAPQFIGHKRHSEIAVIFRPLIKEFDSFALYEKIFRPCYSRNILTEDI
jgi:hypothetical protein